MNVTLSRQLIQVLQVLTVCLGAPFASSFVDAAVSSAIGHRLPGRIGKALQRRRP